MFRKIGPVFAFLSIFSSSIAQAEIDLLSPQSDWVSVLTGSNLDPAQDTQAAASVDLLGDANHSLFYMQYDDMGTPDNDADDQIAFRFRSDHAVDSRSRFAGYIWIGIDMDQDGDIDAFMMLEGKNGESSLQVYDAGSDLNISPSTTDIARSGIPVSEGYVFNLSPAASIPGSGPNDLDGDDDTDYLVSYKVNFRALALALNQATLSGENPVKYVEEMNSGKGVTLKSPFRLVVASAQNAQTLNGDIGGYHDKNDNLDQDYTSRGAFSQKLTFGKPELAINHAGSVLIAGVPSPGHRLEAVVQDEDGVSTASFNFQWFVNGSAILSATGRYYSVVEGDRAKRITVSVSYIDDAGFDESLYSDELVVPQESNIPGSVKLSGLSREDEILTAEVEDRNGIESSVIRYTWYADSDPLTDETGKRLLLTQNHIGKQIYVIAEYIDDASHSERVISNKTVIVIGRNIPGAIELTGTSRKFETLRATVTDTDGLSTAVISYQWFADDVEIVSANTNQYVLTGAEIGKRIHVSARYVDDKGYLESPVSAKTTIVTDINIPGVIDITGDTVEGRTLTAWVSDDNGIASTVIYQWYSNDSALSGETRQILVLDESHVNTRITVSARYLDGQGADELLVSTHRVITYDPERDTDGDGVTNGEEGDSDSDGDGIQDYRDLDVDNDGIPDGLEGKGDSDLDGVPDYRDLDSDNDGLFDVVESGAHNYLLLDSDADGRIDSGYSVGGNGLANILETSEDSDEINYQIVDWDSDKVEDFRDLDSDNDGIPDVVESAGIDPELDGLIGTSIPDVDTDGRVRTIYLEFVDADGDGAPNHQDHDSDNDGLKDIIEAGGLDSNDDGMIDGFYDEDRNGYDDTHQHAPRNMPDTDSDGTPDVYEPQPISDNVPGIIKIKGDAVVGVRIRAELSDENGIENSEIRYEWLRNGMVVSTPQGAEYILADEDLGSEIRVRAYYLDDDGYAETPVSDIRIVSLLSMHDDEDSDGIPNGEDGLSDDDHDSIPNYRDLDSDNDGLPDSVEGTGDTDNDGESDYLDLDSDNDGKTDLEESGITAHKVLDADGDGRIDSNHKVGNNGIADIVETSADSGKTGYLLLDADGDGISDYLAVSSSDYGLIRTGRSGMGLGATGIPIAYLPMLIVLLILARVFDHRQGSSSFRTKGAYIRSFAVLFVTMLFMMEVSAGVTPWPDREASYIGIGEGYSTLAPDLSATSYSVDNHETGSWNLVAGLDLSDRLSLQAYYSNLGKVMFQTGGSISYQDAGFSTVYYALRRERFRQKFALYAKTGIGRMINNAEGVKYERVNDYHVMLGAGLEYSVVNTVSLRVETDLYDLDARMLNVSLIKRFGKKTSKYGAVIARNEVEEKLADNDLDGVVDAKDNCPATRAGSFVDNDGCEFQLPRIHFAFDSSQLDSEAQIALDSIQQIAGHYPGMKIEIGGHTDSRGTEDYNMRLSQRRAEQAYSYLIKNGVSQELLVLKAYGERSAIGDNSTDEGRAYNRRVQFSIISLVRKKEVAQLSN